MSKTRSSQKKVTLSELNNHEVNNKRQALKDLKMLNFDELQYKTVAQKRFYETVYKKDITFCIGPAGCGKTYLSVHRALRELGDKESKIDGIVNSFLAAGLTGLVTLVVLVGLWGEK